jgi:hypothetical protein
MVGVANTHSDNILLILSNYDRTSVLFSTFQRGISNNTQFYTLRILVLLGCDAASLRNQI